MIKSIDSKKCRGCGICDNVCPVDVLRLDTFREESPPCQQACPAGVDIRSYLYLLKQGRYKDAMKLVRESLPLPAITGRVCFHRCESQCARQEVDESVNIHALERFIADYWLNEPPPVPPRLHAGRVAIVGSGPAGLSAAYHLARNGYPVKIWESMPLPGGMLRYGIPEYRLPKTIVDSQINYILGMGVEFQANTTIGKDKTLNELKEEGFNAVILSIGCQSSRKMKIEGSELDGVLWGLDFLRDISLKRKASIGETVIIIGGGDVAVETALSAIRLGAKRARLICLESAAEMPAHKEYLQEAIDEGVEIRCSWGPKRITGKDGRIKGIELVSCSSVFDSGYNFNPCFDESRILELEADTVIFAIGQSPDLSFLPGGLQKTAGNTIAVKPSSATNIPGIFACGDGVTGPTSVVEAMASGEKAAMSVDRFLRGDDFEKVNPPVSKTVETPPKEGIEKIPRLQIPVLPVDRRSGVFTEIKSGIGEGPAMYEAQRCMTCGSLAYIAYLENCMGCYNCEFMCPYQSIDVSPFRKIAPFSIAVELLEGEKYD